MLTNLLKEVLCSLQRRTYGKDICCHRSENIRLVCTQEEVPNAKDNYSIDILSDDEDFCWSGETKEENLIELLQVFSYYVYYVKRVEVKSLQEQCCYSP